MEFTYKQLTIINEALQVLEGRMKGIDSQKERLKELEETLVVVHKKLATK